ILFSFPHFLLPSRLLSLFFFTATATTSIYTLSLHDALPICRAPGAPPHGKPTRHGQTRSPGPSHRWRSPDARRPRASACHRQSRSEEHTSELQSRENLVCRLLLEKKKTEGRNFA